MPADIFFFFLSRELLDKVLDHLDTDDLRNLRLSCHYLRAGSLDKFARRYFRVRRHLVTLESLECLVAISRHEVLGPEIHTITISDSVMGPVHGMENTNTDEKVFMHGSGLIAICLTEVFKNAVSSRTGWFDAGRPTSIMRSWGIAALKGENWAALVLLQCSRWGPFPLGNTKVRYSCFDGERS